MGSRVYKVSEINRYIKSLLEEDVILNGIFLEGEISNYKSHSSGHAYFTLKDEVAAINAVMFKSAKQNLKFQIENGMKAMAFGRVSLYEKTGNYQFYIELLEPLGQGALYFSFNQLKLKLEEEGLFDKAFKQQLPENPETIAIITSKSGAAVRDIIKVSKGRDSGVRLVVVDTLVQGEKAPEEIVASMKMVNEWGGCDLIILGRGGGSIEDLWAFNDERVARAIFKSKIPVISAVGHETDFTITDFVADLRASTPSNAAEIAIKEKYLKLSYVMQLYFTLLKITKSKLDGYKQRINTVINNKYLRNPLQNIYDKQIYLTNLLQDLKKAIDIKIESSKNSLQYKIRVLNSLSPSNHMVRGFSIVSKGGRVIKSIKDTETSDIVKIQLSDGFLEAEIINVGEDNG